MSSTCRRPRHASLRWCGHTGVAPAPGWHEREERALADKDYADTFSEVEAARIGGGITEEQYAVLRRAVVGGAE